MNTILTDDEIKKTELRLRQYKREVLDVNNFARAIETAVLAKLREQKPVGYVTEKIEWHTRQSEQVRKITRTAQPEYGFTAPLYAAPQPAVVQVPQGCQTDAFSSRTCERGTDTCTVYHAAQPSVPAPWREAVKVAREALIDAKTFVGAWPAGTAALAQLDALESGE